MKGGLRAEESEGCGLELDDLEGSGCRREIHVVRRGGPALTGWGKI
jgi:hypothetical protein